MENYLVYYFIRIIFLIIDRLFGGSCFVYLNKVYGDYVLNLQGHIKVTCCHSLCILYSNLNSVMKLDIRKPIQIHIFDAKVCLLDINLAY